MCGWSTGNKECVFMCGVQVIGRICVWMDTGDRKGVCVDECR